jgi:YfiH family protein
MGIATTDLLRVRQVHGAVCVVGTRGTSPRTEADIIIANDPAVALAVQTADCIPLLIADPRTGAVAAAHAGWRGLAARVPEATVTALGRGYGSQPSDLIAAIGPSIGACCYEVGRDVRDQYVNAAFSASALGRWFRETPARLPANPSLPHLARNGRPGHWFFDGWTAAREQLEAAGVRPDRIFLSTLCTASHDAAFCSFRRDGHAAGRMVAVIRPGKPRP